MEILVYLTRVLIIVLVTWLGARILGKKSIAQITMYEFVGLQPSLLSLWYLKLLQKLQQDHWLLY